MFDFFDFTKYSISGAGSGGRKILMRPPIFCGAPPSEKIGWARRDEILPSSFKSDYETCNITGLLIFLTMQTSNSIRPGMHMKKHGRKLGGVTPAPWVVPVTDAKDDGFKW